MIAALRSISLVSIFIVLGLLALSFASIARVDYASAAEFSSTSSSSGGQLGDYCDEKSTFASNVCNAKYVCLNNTCSTCTSSSQCQHDYICKPSSDGHGGKINICRQKRLLSDFSVWDFLATFSCSFGAIISAGAGIGGGGIYVPLMVILGRLSAAAAIPLSKAMILGGAICNFIQYGRARHPRYPSVNKPLIDYDATLLLEPITLAGTMAGVVLNVTLPRWLIVLLVIVILSITCYKTFQKGMSVHKAETIKAAQAKAAAAAIHDEIEAAEELITSSPDADDNGDTMADIDQPNDNEIVDRVGGVVVVRSSRPYVDFVNDPLDPSGDDTSSNLGPGTSRPPRGRKNSSEKTSTRTTDHADGVNHHDEGNEEAEEEAMAANNKNNNASSQQSFHLFSFNRIDDDDENEVNRRMKLEKILEAESTRVPLFKWLMLFLCWVVVLVISLLKGGHGAPSIAGIRCGSAVYWFVFLASFPILIGITYIVGYWIYKKGKTKLRLGYKLMEDDIHWTFKHTFFYPLYCFVAGAAAGLLGIGGGMLNGPLLLDLGANIQVAAATSSFMILFTASSTTAQFTVLGLLPLDYALWYMFWGFVSTLIGQYCIEYLIKKYNKTSYIIFSIAIVIGLSVVLMGGYGIFNTINDLRTKTNIGFRSMCT